MEENLRIKKNDDKIIIRAYNLNFTKSIWFCIYLLIFIFFVTKLENKVNNNIIIFLYFLADGFMLFGKYSLLVHLIFLQFSYNAFEELIIYRDKITIKLYFFMFRLPFRVETYENSGRITISYNNRDNISLEKRGLSNSIFFKRFSRGYSPYTGRAFANYSYLFHPFKLKGLKISDGRYDSGFGTLISKEDYDEILALILAQRAKWEKEHPEDAIGYAPEDSETHIVDSSSQ
jgi:hypothetical protein